MGTCEYISVLEYTYGEYGTLVPAPDGLTNYRCLDKLKIFFFSIKFVNTFSEQHIEQIDYLIRQNTHYANSEKI